MSIEKIGEDSRGHYLYREPNKVGGWRYWSDEIGGGVMIWDTALASTEILELAIQAEKLRAAVEVPPPIPEDGPDDRCICGDKRSDHPKNGPCSHNRPDGFGHGSEANCQEFVLAERAETPAETAHEETIPIR